MLSTSGIGRAAVKASAVLALLLVAVSTTRAQVTGLPANTEIASLTVVAVYWNGTGYIQAPALRSGAPPQLTLVANPSRAVEVTLKGPLGTNIQTFKIAPGTGLLALRLTTALSSTNANIFQFTLSIFPAVEAFPNTVPYNFALTSTEANTGSPGVRTLGLVAVLK